MADSNVFDGPVDVGSNEMFRQLRSAKLSHSCDSPEIFSRNNCKIVSETNYNTFAKRPNT